MIEEYAFGRMTVAGEEHGKDLIVFGAGVRGEEEQAEGGWWRREGHGLHPEDLGSVREARPVVVIGRGAYGRLEVPPATISWLEDLGIQVVLCATTAEAVERYNERAAAGDRVAGAFHLTC